MAAAFYSLKGIETAAYCFAALPIAVAVFTAGCNRAEGLVRVPVAGSVKLQNQPVEDGQIRFIPQGDTAGPLTLAPIRQGKYRCDVLGGVPIGKHRVEILVWDPKIPPPRGPGGKPRPQWAPDKYNKHSTLSMSIEKSDGLVVRDFDL